MSLPFQFRQQLVDQVSIEHFPVDVLPARMGRADANTLRRNQQHAVADAEVAPALPDQLRKIGMALRSTMNFFVDFVNELELFSDSIARSSIEASSLVDAQALADQLDGGLENAFDRCSD